MAFVKKQPQKGEGEHEPEAKADELAPAAPAADTVAKSSKKSGSGVVICRIFAGSYIDIDKTYGTGEEVAIPEAEVAKLSHCMRPVEE